MRILVFVLLLLATFSTVKAQPTALFDARIVPSTRKFYNPYKLTARKAADAYIRDYNQGGYPIVELRFKDFRPFSWGLEIDLDKAFKNHVFSLITTRVNHHVWSDGPDLLVIVERKTRRVIYSGVNRIDGSGNGIDSFDNFLTLYPAKDADDALFKVSTLAKMLALSHNGTLGHMRLKDGTITTLLCHGNPLLLDLGLAFKVNLDKRYRFGKIYFEKNSWERNKCPTTFDRANGLN